MACIKSTGAYIPFYRLKREDIAKAWGASYLGGEKAVANFDEDSLTMAVEAGMDCLKGFKTEDISALYFASTTSPYKEKQAATFIAGALDLQRQITTADFSGSIRAGTNALNAAIDAVTADPDKNVLVIASDSRLGVPGSDMEQFFGDGAAALLVSGAGDVVITESYTHAEEIIDFWRTQEDSYVKMWEERFVYLKGYTENMQEAVNSMLNKTGLNISDFSKTVFYAPDQRRHAEMSRLFKLGKEQIQDPMFLTIGNTGVAHVLMMLTACLEEAKAGEKILLANYGDGCDLFALQVENKFSPDPARRGVKGYLDSKMFNKYEKYIQMRKLMEVSSGRRRPPAVSSAVALHRDRKMILGYYGSKCKNCGRLFFPPQRVCIYCKTKDQFETIRFADKRGKLFTFSKDFLAQSVDPPIITSIVHLDVEDGVRVLCHMTDRNPDEVKVDMPVEMAFKKITEAEGFNNYFWKCRPIR